MIQYIYIHTHQCIIVPKKLTRWTSVRFKTGLFSGRLCDERKFGVSKSARTKMCCRQRLGSKLDAERGCAGAARFGGATMTTVEDEEPGVRRYFPRRKRHSSAKFMFSAEYITNDKQHRCG